jgi:UPF0271 protein
VRIDLNADLGESFGAYSIGDDAALMPSITSANIACGAHAGDPTVMRRTVQLARDSGVEIGAHPGFPDLAGFGRRAMMLSPTEIEDLVLYQLAALAGIARAEGAAVHHLKAHGALYTMAAADVSVATAVARAAHGFDPSLIVFGLAGSPTLTAVRDSGLRVAAEGFADRAYAPDGALASRQLPGAVLTDPAQVLERALRMLEHRQVVATDGSVLPLEVDTICIHGDTPGAAALASSLRAGLERAGVQVRPVSA